MKPIDWLYDSANWSKCHGIIELCSTSGILFWNSVVSAWTCMHLSWSDLLRENYSSKVTPFCVIPHLDIDLYAGLVQRTPYRGAGFSFVWGGDAVQDRRGLLTARKAFTGNWGCSAGLGNQFDGWCRPGGATKQDECAECGYCFCSKHDSGNSMHSYFLRWVTVGPYSVKLANFCQLWLCFCSFWNINIYPSACVSNYHADGRPFKCTHVCSASDEFSQADDFENSEREKGHLKRHLGSQ